MSPRWAPLLPTVLAALAACDPPGSVNLQAAAFVLVRESGEPDRWHCVGAADRTGSMDCAEVEAAHYGLDACADCDAEVTAGSSELLFVTRMNLPRVEDVKSLTAPEFQLVVDGIPAAPTTAGWVSNVIGGRATFEQPIYEVPHTVRSDLLVRLDGGTNLTAELGPVPVTRAALVIDVPSCDALSPCAVLRGGDQVAVTVDVPPWLSGDVTLSQLVDGVQIASAPMAPGSIAGVANRRQVILDVPEDDGASWTLVASHPDLDPASFELLLADSPHVELVLAAPGASWSPDLPAGEDHRGVLGDAEGCREATVFVHATSDLDAPLPATATITVTSAAEVGATIEPAEVELVDGLGVATLRWAAGPATDRAINVSATVASTTTAMRWELDDSPPGASALAPSLATVLVGADGSAKQAVTGLLLSPGADWTLGASTPIAVAITAVADPAATLACSPVATPSQLECDRAGILGSGPKIACGLVAGTTLPTAVATDGAFAFDLASGVCFAGTVTIEVHAPMRDPAAGPPACLWEETAPDELQLVNLATLTYATTGP